jgi:hypothetical protein
MSLDPNSGIDRRLRRLQPLAPLAITLDLRDDVSRQQLDDLRDLTEDKATYVGLCHETLMPEDVRRAELSCGAQSAQECGRSRGARLPA